ncbi:methylglyoxal synthase [Synechococcus sp. SYN20]|uniref:methylglyoxal synthase n=1 Tax=Synechococcus sp. SYN20 TaxID=1050714 RepID=UPI00164886EC|nr:methylglyoxal synthase [Synechococcus sp. SYN20]QNJ27550.1 methylglyoxal synthase [Synechococcus sp. SYN20]
MDRNVLVEALQREGNLKYSFNADEIASLTKHMSIEVIDEQSTLMSKGEPSDSMVFVVDGLLQVLDGEKQIALEKPRAILGESLFSDEATRVADVQAMEPTTVGRFSLHDFKSFLDKIQSLALKYREYFRAIGRARNEQLVAENYSDNCKYLALIAQNNMKAILMEFCSMHSKKLETLPLIATGTTGSMLYAKTRLSLRKKVASGPLGGDQAVGTLISTKNICGVIFFRDPLSSHPHHADIEALGRLCDVYQIPFATNPQSSEAILDYLLSGKSNQEIIPNHVLEAYVQGQKKVVEAG